MLVPLLVRVTDCAAAVVPTTVLPKAKLEGVRVTPGAVPLPLRATTVAPLALLLTVNVPVLLPTAVGVKVMPTMHDEPAAIAVEVEQVVVVASRAKSPETTKLVKLSGAMPVLFRVTVSAGLVAPTTWLPKARLATVGVTIGRPTPVPLRETSCALLGALSVIVSRPVRAPATVGVKETLIVQLPAAATELPQLFVSVKSPLATILVTDIALLAGLESVTVCDELVVFTS